jgi:transcriptional regulator with XRE-family HTH domain
MTRASEPQAAYGALVLGARSERGWAQSELARVAKLSRRTVSRIEAGLQPAPLTREALDDVLDLPCRDKGMAQWTWCSLRSAGSCGGSGSRRAFG